MSVDTGAYVYLYSLNPFSRPLSQSSRPTPAVAESYRFPSTVAMRLVCGAGISSLEVSSNKIVK